MKREFPVTNPDGLVEDWPGQYVTFSWLDYGTTLPNVITLITTRKANGAANACLSAWGMLIGGREDYSSLVAVAPTGHTYANIMRDSEWCVNFPPLAHRQAAFATIQCNGPDNDEIADAGLTAEPGIVVRAPRIAECPVSLECKLDWHRPLSEGSDWYLCCGRVVRAAIDEALLTADATSRIEGMQLMYNVRSTLHPLTGEKGPAAVALLGNVTPV